MSPILPFAGRMEIPFRQLSSEALQGLIEEFVTRDGTDYGEQEVSVEQKVAEVERQLQRGEAVILFDQASGSCNIILRKEMNARP